MPLAETDVDLTILDVGWSARELLGDATGRRLTWISRARSVAEVVVTRSDDVALCQAELVLGSLMDAHSPGSSPTTVVVVGPAHGTRAVAGAAGPCVRDLLVANRVWFAPTLPGRVSLGPDPLPRRLRAFGHRLLDEVFENERAEG